MVTTGKLILKRRHKLKVINSINIALYFGFVSLYSSEVLNYRYTLQIKVVKILQTLVESEPKAHPKHQMDGWMSCVFTSF